MHDETNVTLKDIRRRLGLIQRDFARKLGVSGRTVTRWELGQSAVPAEAFQAALNMLHAVDARAAEAIALRAQLPGANEREESRRIAVDHAVYAVADALDVTPGKARRALSTFLTHILAAGLGPAEAREKLNARIQAEPREGPSKG